MYKVLIADDEEKVCKLIFGLVDWAALSLSVVKIVHDGVAAMEAIEALRPDIVITDIRMPGLTGLELIKDTKDRFPETDFVIISGYRHFDYAHTAIKYGVEDYLLKPLRQQEFLDTLEKLIEKKNAAAERRDDDHARKNDLSHLHAELIARWCGPAKAEMPRDIAALNDEYRLALAPGKFLAVSIQADTGYMDEEAPLRSVLCEKLSRIARERLMPSAHEVLMTPILGGVFGMINCEESALAEVRRGLHHVVEERALLRDLCPTLRVTVGVSNEKERVSEMPEAMREAADAACERILQGTDRVLAYAKAAMPALSLALPQESRRGLTTAVETLDAAAYERQLKGFFERLRRVSGLSALYVRRCFLEVAGLHQYALNPAAVDGSDALREICARRFDRCGSFSEAEGMLSELLLSNLTKAAEAVNTMETRPIRQARQIMQERYSEPLTLESVSQQIGFHPAYFSTLYKKVTGENFLEALCAIRMEAAKQLLVDGNLAITDVAERVGYNDAKHFTKLFKKAMGLTPNEYRKLYY